MRIKMRVFRYYISCFFFLFISLSSFSQRQTQNWYFGRNAGLSFATTPPTPLLNGALNTFEGCATFSDDQGNLLFYTDGMNVYNKNHQRMPNGVGLMGNPSSAQSGIIVPNPNSSTKYYLFTVDAEGGANGLRYSEVDLSLNGGLGDVITSTKNTPLFSPAEEKIAAVRHSSLPGAFWVIAHGFNNNRFYAYLINNNGVNAPVISNVGTSVNSAWGYLAVSPNGARIACAYQRQGFELYDFNSSTGVVSNPILLSNQTGCYGVSFSPDNSILYGTNLPSGAIFQWNLNAGSPSAIINSRVQIGTGRGNDGFLGGAIQQGLDNKLYISQYEQPFLSVINNPNVLGAGCNLQYSAISLQGRNASLGLPPFLQSFFFNCNVNLLPDTTKACGVSVTLDAGSGYTNYSWSTGQSTQAIQVTSSGMYRLSFTGPDGCNGADSTYVSLINANILNSDSTICKNSSITLTVENTPQGATPCSISQIPSNLRTGLQGYWPFCGNANDISGNNNNGVVSGAVLSPDRFGNPNSAYTFDGSNDFIETAYRNHLPSFTISAWVKLASPACFSSIIDAHESSWEFLTDCNGGTNLSFAFWTSAVGYIIYPSNYNLSVGAWTHVVCTFENDNTCKIYANGILRATISTTSLRNTSGRFYFGRSRSGTDQFLNGSLDDIAIWDRALTLSEVNQVFQAFQPAGPPQTILWSTGATSSSLTVTPTQTTTYYATISNGISSCRDSVKLTIPVAPSISNKSYCVGATVPSITLSSPNSSITYDWINSNGLIGLSLSGTGSIPSFIAAGSGTGSQTAQITITPKVRGCEGISNSFTYTIFPGATANAGPDATIVAGDRYTMQASATPGTYSWTPAGTLSNPASLNPVATPPFTTIYRLSVITSQGCTATDEMTINVVPYCLKPMNAFSPNGDGTNDRWVVTNGPCLNRARVKVFNRYGSLVFEDDDYKNNWDGTYNNLPLPEGTYYYTVSFLLLNGNLETKSGNVTLLR